MLNSKFLFVFFALPMFGQATVEVTGSLVSMGEMQVKRDEWIDRMRPNANEYNKQIEGGWDDSGGTDGSDKPSELVSYYAEWVSNEYKYPFRQIAKIESPSGAKISFQNVDSLKKMWNYEISLKFSEFGVSLGSGYEAVNTVTIGWETQLPDLAGTYVAVANEGVINDYYKIVKKTIFGENVVANNQLAQKHDKITVELYRNGARIN